MTYVGLTYITGRKIADDCRFGVDISTDFYRSSQNTKREMQRLMFILYTADAVAGGRTGRENETIDGKQEELLRVHTIAYCTL